MLPEVLGRPFWDSLVYMDGLILGKVTILLNFRMRFGEKIGEAWEGLVNPLWQLGALNSQWLESFQDSS